MQDKTRKYVAEVKNISSENREATSKLKFYIANAVKSVPFYTLSNEWLDSCSSKELEKGKWFKHGDDVWFAEWTENHEWRVQMTEVSEKNYSVSLLHLFPETSEISYAHAQ